MITIGFPISSKENEFRRALLPAQIEEIDKPENLYFEEDYGQVIGFSNQDYIDAGANIVSREEVLAKDIICDPKIGDAEYLDRLDNQIIFGWVHAVQNKEITDKIIEKKITAYAWEDMDYSGRHVFYRNNEIAGEAAVVHALQFHGEMLYNSKVAIIGNGNVAKGAYKILSMLGADIISYNRRTEGLLREEIYKYDIIVNAVLWDTEREDHIIHETDLEYMKKNAYIIDISCDENGGIETSIPTTIKDPVYKVNDILHYVVDHTPSIFYKTSSESISYAVVNYINELLSNNYSNTLKKALIIEKGRIIDERINKFQHR